TLSREYQLAEGADGLFTRSEGVVEVVVPPRSPLIGLRVFRGMVTESGELIVLAVGREDADFSDECDVELRAGDALVLRGTWTASHRQIDDEVLVVDGPDAVRRQVVPLGLGAKESLAVLAAMIGLLVTDAVPPSVAALLAAGALVLLGVTSMERAYRAISW